MGIEEIFHGIEELPPADLAKVVDFALRVQERRDAASADTDLAAVAASPTAKAKLNELIRVGLDQAGRGEIVDGEAVFAELLGEA